jgi:ferric-dicitrate binding protein FerR (iron transport regulator)
MQNVHEIEEQAADWVYRSEDPSATAETLMAREAWLARSLLRQVIYFRLAWGRQRTKELMGAREDLAPPGTAV